MSNLNLNKVVLCGRLTADPELKQTGNGISVVTFTLAVNRRYQSRSADGAAAQQQQADFISVVAWRQTAEFISRYFRKGSSLCVTGSIQTRTWQDQQGQKRYATEVVADEVSFVASAAQTAAGAAPAGSSYTPEAYGAPAFTSTPGANFEEIPNDGDLPC